MTIPIRHVSEPIQHLPIGPRLYPVARLTREQIKGLWPEVTILARCVGKPVTGEITEAFVATIKALVQGDHPELTDDYVASWLSQGLCNMSALEFQRQYLALAKFARA